MQCQRLKSGWTPQSKASSAEGEEFKDVPHDSEMLEIFLEEASAGVTLKNGCHNCVLTRCMHRGEGGSRLPHAESVLAVWLA